MSAISKIVRLEQRVQELETYVNKLLGKILVLQEEIELPCPGDAHSANDNTRNLKRTDP